VTATAGGTGIGLALVRRFVTLLGGRVTAANNPGPGCTICIELPG
jgi:signal transduction histidine kinase